MKIWCFIALLIGGHDSNTDVHEFFRLLQRDTNPSVADFYNYYGQGAEGEVDLEIVFCGTKGWGPPDKDPRCLDYHRKRYINANNEKSFYLEWLKSKLPQDSRSIKIVRVEKRRGKDLLEHDLIYTILDNCMVMLWRTVGDGPHVSQFGILGISSINGKKVSDLLEQDVKHGYVPRD